MKHKLLTNWCTLNGIVLLAGTVLAAEDVSDRDLDLILESKAAEPVRVEDELPEFQHIVQAIDDNPDLLNQLKNHYGRGPLTFQQLSEALHNDDELRTNVASLFAAGFEKKINAVKSEAEKAVEQVKEEAKKRIAAAEKKAADAERELAELKKKQAPAA